jgi:1-acyl-sn-glycerol-3-phosphate acyltransferase
MRLWQVLRDVAPGPLVRAIYRPDVDGLAHVPVSDGAILVSNHLSRADPGFLQLAVDRQVVFAVHARFYRYSGIRWFLDACDAVPVDPAGGESTDQLVAAAGTVLAEGRLFCMYPEGGIARDGRVHRGRTGVGRLVAATGAPVLPVAMLNTDLLLPPVRRLPVVRRARIRIGRPLEFAPEAPAREITDAVMRAVARLSGRAYVDEYLR